MRDNKKAYIYAARKAESLARTIRAQASGGLYSDKDFQTIMACELQTLAKAVSELNMHVVELRCELPGLMEFINA